MDSVLDCISDFYNYYELYEPSASYNDAVEYADEWVLRHPYESSLYQITRETLVNGFIKLKNKKKIRL